MVDAIENIQFDFHKELKFSPVYKRSIQQLTLLIPGGGCKYWCKSKGKACLFCGFPGLTRKIIRGDGFEDDYTSCALPPETYWNMYHAAMEAEPDFDKLALFNGGSFFIDDEIPEAFRLSLYDHFSALKTSKQLMVESRPEYITQDNISTAKSRLGSKDFMVAIGLESFNNHVRNKLMKKGTSLRQFENAVNILKNEGAQVMVYAFLKAPGLTEKDALQDMSQTLDYLHDMGVDEIAVSCAFVPPGTPLETLYNNGEFRPPWLWTVLEIINLAKEKNIPITIGGFDDQPPPVAVPHNCDHCNDDIMNIIQTHRETGRLNNEKQPSCTCQTHWQTEMS